MNTEKPHDIVDGIEKVPMEKRGQYIPLTPDEAARLRFASMDERAAFIAQMPTEKLRERMTRWIPVAHE